MAAKVLIVEDDKRTLDALARGLEGEGYETLLAHNGHEAVSRLARSEVDVVVTDLKMPYMDGMELLESVRSLYPDTIVILMTAYATVEKAVAAIKQGAYDFVTKPINLDRLDHVIRKALDHRELRSENLRLRQRLKEMSPFDRMIGMSPEIQQVFEKIRQVGPTDATVIIQGDSGTGKELVADAIHYVSPRADGP
ncbi:MAG: sigma-54-dependent transcriptional regulator, partial [Nitrospinota bacterium]